ncbi:TPA: hypothetical protein ACHKQ6_004161 [Escherichia coli]
MITITKERLLTIKQWRETYGPGMLFRNGIDATTLVQSLIV